jgi:hypothetical protein
MSTRIDLARACALALFACTEASAAPPVAPPRPLEDPAALKAAFAERIGRPVQVLGFRFGEHYSEMLVENTDGEFDVFEASPGQPMAEGRPKKAGEVDCRKKTPFAALDFVLGARLLAQARAIAGANGYGTPESVELGAGILCEAFGWRARLTQAAGTDALLELHWAPDGGTLKARHLEDGRWVKLDQRALLAGGAQAPPAAPKEQPKSIPGDGRERDFFAGIESDLARLEAAAGSPLALHLVDIDRQQLSVVLAQPRGRMDRATWLVDAQGGLRRWHEDDGPSAWCRKTFALADVPLAGLPAMIAQAPALIPPMAESRVANVTIRRSGTCGKPHVYIKLEDERGYGNVEYDQRGKLLRAEIQ